MSRLLNRSSLRYLLRHPWQIGLSVIGIALGVAVVISVDLANQSAGRAFDLSMESVTGRATHHIIGGPAGVPDTVYRQLRVKQKFRQSAPVIESHVLTNNNGNRTLRLFGIDPFAEALFRPLLTRLDAQEITAFLTTPGAALLSQSTADRLGVTIGDTLSVTANSVRKKVHIIGTISAVDERSRNALQNLLITDISTAQELLQMSGRISRIDLIIPDNAGGSALVKQLESTLPNTTTIRRSEIRNEAAAQMVAAFQINLTALSLLALVVGMFLIYNTMTFSVVQRRSYIGLFRSIGVTRHEIFSSIQKEALTLGIIGTLIGTAGGVLLGRGMVRLVTQSINDLYFVVSVQELQLSGISLAKGALLGIGATFLAALKPAREATSAATRVVLSRSMLEQDFRRKVPMMTAISFALLAVGALVLWFPDGNIYFSYSGIIILVFGFALLTPITILTGVRLLAPLMGKFFGIFGRMAARDIISQMSRINVAIAALTLAVATAVGVGTMIDSFRETVIVWLERRLEADIFISTPSLVARRNDGSIAADFLHRIENVPGIREIDYYRELEINSVADVFLLRGIDIEAHNYSGYRFKSGDPNKIWPAFHRNEAVIVSESFAFRHNLSTEDVIHVPTDRGPHDFLVAGIYYDYASDLGVISMNYPLFRTYFDDPSLSGISLFIDDNITLQQVIHAVEDLVLPGEEIFVMSQRTLLDKSIEIFDRTFIITNVLQLLAIVVAFIGILSAFMALQLERSREFGILRANGMTVRQVWKLVSTQTTLMGLIAGMLSLPLGNMLAWVLIYIINKRSFGWTLQFQFSPMLLLQAVLLAVVAAVLAGIYPAWRMANTSPVLALREE